MVQYPTASMSPVTSQSAAAAASSTAPLPGGPSAYGAQVESIRHGLLGNCEKRWRRGKGERRQIRGGYTTGR